MLSTGQRELSDDVAAHRDRPVAGPGKHCRQWRISHHTRLEEQVERRSLGQQRPQQVREGLLDERWWNSAFQEGICFIGQRFLHFRLKLLKTDSSSALPENVTQYVSDLTQKSVFVISFPSDLDSCGPRTTLGEPQSRQMGELIWVGGGRPGRRNHLWSYKVGQCAWPLRDREVMKALLAMWNDMNLIVSVLENPFQCEKNEK